MKDPVYTLMQVGYKEDGTIDSRTIHEFQTATLDELLRNVEYFVKGCSFYPPEGSTLEFV